MYKILVEKNAEKDIKKLPNEQLSKIIYQIRNLADNPLPAGCKKLNSNESYYRIRVGNYRIIYSVDFLYKIVRLYRIRHRKSVYKNI